MTSLDLSPLTSVEFLTISDLSLTSIVIPTAVTGGTTFEFSDLPSLTTLGCNPLANTGWIGFASFGGNAGSYRGLRFRFTNFGGGTPATPVIFEFDADTDGGIGNDGDEMAGCIVRVVLTNGQVRETELRVDPTVPDRAVGGF